MSEPASGIAPIEVHHRGRLLTWVALGLVLAFLIAALVLPLLNINRYHRTVAESLSRSVGRPVHLGSVQLQLLPRPGLAITDFVVEEDPGFGAEPLLRAPSVTVSLRPTSLWRGRLEVSRIDLDNASLNLVRDARGQWNFGSLVIQAARIPNAPTAQHYATATPRFPYIEFRAARINFKTGEEKKAFSFLNSDASIWLDEPDRWRLRFEAQPARTDLDLDLADTGVMRLEGSIDRASALDQMQVNLHAEWSKAPLGQVSRMLFGRDSGWRGLLRAEADFAGDMRALRMNARFRVDDAHREEFTPLTPLNIDVRCRGGYQRATSSIDDLTCLWPVGDGHLLLTGNIRKPTQPEAHLTLEINSTPASFAVSALGLLRRGVTPSLGATGLINGQFAYAGQFVFANGEFASRNSAPALSGQATVDSLTLSLPGIEKPLEFPALHFTTPALAVPLSHARRGMAKKHVARPKDSPAHVTILLEAASLAQGSLHPLELSGKLTGAGFEVRVAGQADLDHLTALSRSSSLLGSSLARLTPASEGHQATANLDLTFAGPWMTIDGAPETLTTTQGWVQIGHAQAKLDWLPEPVEIASATATFSPGKVTWNNASFTINGIAAHGSFTYPLHCDEAENCAASDTGGPNNTGPIYAGDFNLDVASLDAAALQSALIGAGRHGELLSAILAQVERKTTPWPPVSGTVHVGAFTLGDLMLHDAHLTLSVHENRLEIVSLDAGALSGSVHLTGSMETAGSHPIYSLNLNWEGIVMAQAAAIFHEKWGAGTMNGNAKLTLEGYSASDLASSAKGTFQWDWVNGSLVVGAPLAVGAPLSSGVSPTADKVTSASPVSATTEKASLADVRAAKFSPAHFSHWPASGTIANRTLTFNPADQSNPVTGTITFDRELNLVWPAKEAAMIRIGDTLAHPKLELSQTISER